MMNSTSHIIEFVDIDKNGELIHIIKDSYIVPSLNAVVNIDGIKYKVYDITYSIRKHEGYDSIIASVYLKRSVI